MADLKPEYRLLAAAAAPFLHEDTAGEGDLDWPEVQRLAHWHRLSPLLFRYLRHRPCPSEVLAALDAERLVTAAWNVSLVTELRNVVRALDGEGIRAMALKGAALLELVYPDVGLRPMVDLDLLVPAEDIARAERTIVGLGFRSARPNASDPRQSKYAYPVLVRADGRVHIDLHRHLLPEAAFPLTDLWARRVPSAQGLHWLPAAEDLVIHLAAHFFKDRLARSAGALGQLADLAWSADTLDLDWDELARRASDAGLRGRVFLAFMAANELLGPVIPSPVVDALRPRASHPRTVHWFLERRVLDTRKWPPPGYFGRLPAGSGSFAPSRRPFRRLVPSRAYLVQRYGAGSYGRLYLERVRTGVATLRASQPSDLLLTRWMRSLS